MMFMIYYSYYLKIFKKLKKIKNQINLNKLIFAFNLIKKRIRL